MTIVEFLRARLDEDEATARVATPGPWLYSRSEREMTIEGADGHTVAELMVCPDHEGRRLADGLHITGHDPARVLREVEAKRAIVDEYVELRDRCAAAWVDYSDWLEGKPVPERGPSVSSHDPAIRDALSDLLRLLALPYADHPDYDTAWFA